MKTIQVFTDGGSRGNPGPAAYGVFVADESMHELAGFGKTIGVATNNIAEYQAVIAALSWVDAHKEKLEIEKVVCYLDSELVVRQLNGIYKMKNAALREKMLAIRVLEEQIGLPISYSHIPREENKKADGFVNQALDNS